MEKKIYSIQQILGDLNKNVIGAPWEAIDGVFGLSKVSIDKEKNQVAFMHESLVLKSFVKPDTGEIRTYVSKVLNDEPETSGLE